MPTELWQSASFYGSDEILDSSYCKKNYIIFFDTKIFGWFFVRSSSLDLRMTEVFPYVFFGQWKYICQKKYDNKI